MDREIKFRAWDKRTKLMFFTSRNWNEWNRPNNDYTRPIALPFTDDKYVVMQVTGLKDKNGKEIYEGDLVKFPDQKCYCGKTNMNGALKAVEYSEWAVTVWTLNGYNTNGDYKISSLHKAKDKIEVIGNIYENPELLEKST